MAWWDEGNNNQFDPLKADSPYTQDAGGLRSVRVINSFMSGAVACIHGYNATYGVDETDVCPQDTTIPLPTGSTPMEAISSDASDDDGADGVRTIKVYGLSESGIEQNETVTMNGTNAVVLSNEYFRINRVVVTSVGISGSAVGNISIRGAGGGSTYSYVASGDNASLQALYTVPAGKTAYLKTFCAGVSARETRITLNATCNPVDRTLMPGIFVQQNVIVTQDAHAQIVLDIPLFFPALCDIKVSVKGLAAGTGYASTSFQLILR